MGRMARTMSLLPDTHNCGLRMCRGCGERFPRHRLQRKPLDSDPGMYHGKRMTHAPWCMSRSLTRVAEYRSCHSQRCATWKCKYLVKDPWGQITPSFHVYWKTAAITDHASARMYVLLVPRVSRQVTFVVSKVSQTVISDNLGRCHSRSHCLYKSVELDGLDPCVARSSTDNIWTTWLMV